MSGEPKLDKQSAAGTATPPRMLGDTDVGVIMQFVEKLPADASILEVGPWLGGLTLLLSRHGRVTVADRFIWTDANADDYPGIAAPGESFRPAFEANMAAAGIHVDIIETTLPEMSWGGGPIDFVFVDAPRNAELLHGCFKGIASAVRPGALILVKQALNPAHFGMGAYLDALAGLGFVGIETTEQPEWCNIATVRVNESFATLADIPDPIDIIATAPVADGPNDPWYGNRLSFLRLAGLAAYGQWTDAYAHLCKMPTGSESLALWDEIEVHLWEATPQVEPQRLALLSDLVWIRNDMKDDGALPIIPNAGLTSRLKAYWRNNASKDWLFEGILPDIFADDSLSTTLEQLLPYAEHIYDGDIIGVGDVTARWALGALLFGAESYVGLSKVDVTDLDKTLNETFPHMRMVSDTDQALAALPQASVLIMDANESLSSELHAAVDARSRSNTDQWKIIKLKSI